MKGPGERVCQGKYRARLEDGDFVFTHTEYTFAIGHRVGFDIFRFENGKMVEHWDNL
ncbi:MAG: hypothetical protein QOF56_1939 [Acidobacteriaceae bacterium]|jgi:predicted SnoaL-like aldol condensation-catalyzing enzyme|nr:hypothetical protein [Acidobacteriaceae bacterium]